MQFTLSQRVRSSFVLQSFLVVLAGKIPYVKMLISYEKYVGKTFDMLC